MSAFLYLTWYSHFCRESYHFLCSTTFRFRRAAPGSRSTWGIGCASSSPWCKGGNGLRFCPHSLHTASRTENPHPLLVAGCCLQGSPLSLQDTEKWYIFIDFTWKCCVHFWKRAKLVCCWACATGKMEFRGGGYEFSGELIYPWSVPHPHCCFTGSLVMNVCQPLTPLANFAVQACVEPSQEISNSDSLHNFSLYYTAVNAQMATFWTYRLNITDMFEADFVYWHFMFSWPLTWEKIEITKALSIMKPCSNQMQYRHFLPAKLRRPLSNVILSNLVRQTTRIKPNLCWKVGRLIRLGKGESEGGCTQTSIQWGY